MTATPANVFTERLRAHDPQIGLWLALGEPYPAEILAGVGFDWLLIDAEHAPNDVRSVLAQLRAIAAAGSPPGDRPPTSAVVRVPSADPVTIKQFLEIGAQTLLVPLVNTAAEARAAVAAAKYPPAGVRGMGSGLARSSRWRRYSDYIEVANDVTGVVVQIETAEAVSNIAEIATTPGVDGILVGPSDLAASMGLAGRPVHPEVLAASLHAIRTARRLGTPAGVMGPESALPQWLDAGVGFFAVTSDVALLTEGAATLLARLTALAGQARRADRPG